MSVDREEVRHIARLARLELSEEELDRFTPQLANILGHIDLLRELGEHEVDELQEPRRAPLRADDVGADPLTRAPEEMAPDWRDGFFAVPRLAAQEQQS